MKRRNILLIALGILVFIAASGATVFFAYRTVSTTGQQAVAQMNDEERTALELLSSIKPTMDIEQVYAKLGPPSEDMYVLAKWNGFAGSALSQVRVYFVADHPRKIRWIKLGFFVYEKNL